MLREDLTDNGKFKQRPKGCEVFPKGSQAGSGKSSPGGVTGQRSRGGTLPGIFKE